MAKPRVRWEPLFAGEKAKQLVGATREMAKRMLARPPQNASLGNGLAGGALFLGELGTLLGEQKSLSAARRWAVEAVTLAAAEPNFRFLDGLPGIAYALGRLERLGVKLPKDALRLRDEVEEMVERLLVQYPDRLPLDLGGGVAGYVVLARERLPRARSKRILAEVVKLYHRSALQAPEGNGVFWRTTGLPPLPDGTAREQLVDLGVTHGVVGMLAALAVAREAGVEARRAGTLLKGGLAWFLARATPRGEAGLPSLLSDDGTTIGARFAWCYGTPGVAAALHGLGELLRRPDLRKLGVTWALSVTPSHPLGREVEDAGLCHGQAGVGHLLNRVYQADGQRRAELAELARAWLERGLETTEDKDVGPELTLLDGDAGVGLCVLSAVSKRPLGWDRFLLA